MLRTQSNAQGEEAGSERYRGVLPASAAGRGGHMPGLYRGVDKKLAHCTVLTCFAIYEKIAARTFRLLGVKKLRTI